MNATESENKLQTQRLPQWLPIIIDKDDILYDIIIRYMTLVNRLSKNYSFKAIYLIKVVLI